ncbi:MAG: hypothetical protein K6G88_00355 [Lachnospiraceae bacterium]|nr:hypothetical protein [Lachnospiraceae bacterium]
MVVINEEKIQEFVENIDENDYMQVENLGFSLMVYQKMRGNIDLPAETFIKIKDILVNYYNHNINTARDFAEYCLVVTGYLIKYNRYEEVLKLYELALKTSQSNYYKYQDNADIVETYALVLFYLAEHYFKERKENMYAILYYTKAFDVLLNNKSKMIIRKGNAKYVSWLSDIEDKIKLITDMEKGDKTADKRILTEVLNAGKVQ